MKKYIITLLLAVTLLTCTALADPTPKMSGGADMATASVLAADQLVLSELISKDDPTQLQYYAYYSADAAQYTVCSVENLGSTGNSDGFRLKLFDQDGAVLFSSAVKSGRTVSCGVKLPVGAPVYAEIYGYHNAINGTFRICFSVVADDEGDTGIPLVSGAVHTINVNSDTDVFTLQTGSAVTYIDLTATNISCDGSWYYEMYDDDNVRIHKDDLSHGKSESKSLRLEPDTLYTIYTSTGKCSGNYRFDYTLSDDLHSDAADGATPLTLGEERTGALQTSKDVDCFLLDSQELQAYHCLTLINASADRKLTATVYDVYEQKIGKFSANIGETGQLYFKLPAAGQYTVSITGDRGGYALTHTLVSDPESDILASANTVSPGAAQQHALEAGNDVDFFIVPAADAERIVGVSLDSTLDEEHVKISVYDQHERILSETTVRNKRASFTVQQIAGESLYIRVTGEKAARYVLQLCAPDAHAAAPDWTVAVKPTCTAPGQQDRLCLICGGVVVSEVLPELGHVCGDWRTQTAATCTHTGTATAQCTRCYETAFSKELPMLEHTADNWKTILRATCTETGTNEQRCTYCNALLATETVPATGHQAGTPTVTKATCTAAGSSTVSCTVCYTVLSTEELPVAEHTPGTPAIVKATCSNTGSSTVSCTVCKTVLSVEELPLIAHTVVSWKQTSDPTCTESGWREQFCTHCNITLSREEVPALGHKTGSVKTTPATCTTAGKNEQYCTACKVLLSSEEIPAAGHGQGVWHDTRTATCTSDGERTEYCSGCNIVLSTAVVTAHGHSPAEWQTVQTASCTAKGLREQRCSVCGAVIASEESDALGHSYTEWSVTIEATKEAEGENTRHCIHCGDTQFEAIPKIEKFLGIF